MQTSAVYRSALVEHYPGLTIATSLRVPSRPLENSMNFLFDSRLYPDAKIRERDAFNNIFGFLHQNDLLWHRLVTPRQVVHGSEVAVITYAPGGQLSIGEEVPFQFPSQSNGGVDAIVTNQPLILGMHGADCPWALAFDPESSVFGAAHLGWRPVSKRLVTKFVRELMLLGADRKRLKVHLGRGAGSCCYEVGTDVIAEFINGGLELVRDHMEPHPTDPGRKCMLDLAGMIAEILIRGGVQEDNIELDPRCTMCTPELHSFRRDRGTDPTRDLSGRNMAVISWQPSKG